MPPGAVRNVRDLLYWQYAKLIAKSAGYDRNYGFIMNRFKRLQAGKISWSGSIREYVKEREAKDRCIYCESTEGLSTDHLIPASRGGPDTGDNAVVACKRCNSSKGDRGLYEWFGLARKDEVPRIAVGKYLKLLYDMHAEEGTLDIDRTALPRLCGRCEVQHMCDRRKLTVYCLESILMRSTS